MCPALIKALTAFEALVPDRPPRSPNRGYGIGSIHRHPRAPRRHSSNPARLTARQSEILELLREGLTGPQIATQLHISPKTAENPRQRDPGKAGRPVAR